MSSLQHMLEADCSILLIRALYGKSVVAFGDDGLGKYGQSSHPKTFTIEDMDLEITCDDDGVPTGFVSLKLEGYNSADCGHVATDNNLTIALRQLLIDEHIDPNCLTWAEKKMQGDVFCTLMIDVPLLLDWA